MMGSRQDFVNWYNPEWAEKIPTKKLVLPDLRKALEKSVKGQMMSDVPYGVLLSGGLDSSLIAAIASKLERKGLNPATKRRLGGHVCTHLL